MIESYEKRVAVFLDSAKTLNPELHIQYEDSMHRKDNIERNWQKLNDEFGVWSQKIEDNKTFLELLTTMDDMQQFINEKEKVAQDVSYRDPSHLRNKLKKHEVLAGEVKANGSEMTLIKHNVEKLREEKHRQNLPARKESRPPNGKLLRKNAVPELQDSLGKIFHLILFGCKKIGNESRADIRA